MLICCPQESRQHRARRIGCHGVSISVRPTCAGREMMTSHRYATCSVVQSTPSPGPSLSPIDPLRHLSSLRKNVTTTHQSTSLVKRSIFPLNRSMTCNDLGGRLCLHQISAVIERGSLKTSQNLYAATSNFQRTGRRAMVQDRATSKEGLGITKQIQPF